MRGRATPSSQKRARRRAVPVLGICTALVAGAFGTASASSHREAPLITEDPVADITDVYAFVSPDKADTVTLIANVIPFQDPAGGPNFFKFGDDVLYTINVDSDGDAIADKKYDFRFTTALPNANTFLYNTGQVTTLGDGDLAVRQTYSVAEIDNSRDPRGRGRNREDDDRDRDDQSGLGRRKLLAVDVPVPPANVGVRSTPNYEANLGEPAVKSLQDGISVFAGPRDDPFFADLGSIFDLGTLQPFSGAHVVPSPAKAPEDYVANKNVHSIAIQIPKSRLVEGNDPVIGVWATTSRRRQRVLDGEGGLNHNGNWVQVARLGMPLVNEVVIPRGKKDVFNAVDPTKDLQFAGAVLKPELGALIPFLYPGVTVPTEVNAGLGLGGREDIATIFLTGIPGVNKPASVTPSEMLRLNTSTASAFPNGRKLTDDVVDASLQVVAGATAFSPAFNKAPNNALGDGVNGNDVPLKGVFPYVAPPHAGTD